MALLDNLIGGEDPVIEEHVDQWSWYQGGFEYGEEGTGGFDPNCPDGWIYHTVFGCIDPSQWGGNTQDDLLAQQQCLIQGLCWHPDNGCQECPPEYEDDDDEQNSCPGVNCPAGTELNEETCACEQVEEYDCTTCYTNGLDCDPNTGQCIQPLPDEDILVEDEYEFTAKEPRYKPDYTSMKDYLLKQYGIEGKEKSKGYLGGLLGG